MSRKSEASIEFMIFLGLLLVFFVFFIGIVGVNNNDIDESTVFTSAGNILNTVANEINTASRIQGYYREFFIPDSLSDGEHYNVTILNSTNLRMVELNWTGGKNVVDNIITSNVTGTVVTGENMIRNQYGEVIINEG